MGYQIFLNKAITPMRMKISKIERQNRSGKISKDDIAILEIRDIEIITKEGRNKTRFSLCGSNKIFMSFVINNGVKKKGSQFIQTTNSKILLYLCLNQTNRLI